MNMNSINQKYYLLHEIFQITMVIGLKFTKKKKFIIFQHREVFVLEYEHDHFKLEGFFCQDKIFLYVVHMYIDHESEMLFLM